MNHGGQAAGSIRRANLLDIVSAREMEPLPVRCLLLEKRQRTDQKLVNTTRTLTAAHDQNDRTRRVQAQLTAGLLNVKRAELFAHRSPGGDRLLRLKATQRFRKANKRRIHKPQERTIGATGDSVGFVEKGLGTQLARGKETREIDGRMYVLEHAIKGDVALVEAWQADRWGNLTYKLSGRNFNPIMAMASELSIVQTQHVVELGQLDPDNIHTPGIFVDRVLHVPYGDPTGF